MIPRDISDEYYQAFSRSLLVWQNVFREIDDGSGMEETVKAFRKGLRVIQDEEIRSQDPAILELERLFGKLHKNHIHLMKDREGAHQLARLIEEQIRILKLGARKKGKDPLT